MKENDKCIGCKGMYESLVKSFEDFKEVNPTNMMDRCRLCNNKVYLNDMCKEVFGPVV